MPRNSWGCLAIGAACACLATCGGRPDAVGRVEPPAAGAADAHHPPARVRAGLPDPIVLMWQVQQSGPHGDFALLRRLGINTVQSSRITTWPPSAVLAYLDAAEDAGLRVIAYLGLYREGTGPDCRYAPEANRFVAQYRSHPALLAWHSLDEPAGHGITPACQRALYAAIKLEDPVHAVMVSTNNDDESAYERYFAADAFDIYEVHKYVNPHPGTAQRDLLGLLGSLRPHGYPVIVTLRAFNAPAKPLRLDMTAGSFDEQYDFFIERPGLTRDVGFYGWELSPNRGIRDDPAIRGAFIEFMERRFRERESRLR